MTDKLREAAQAALKLLDDDDRDCAFAARILKAALAEPAIKESLTVAEQKPVAWLHWLTVDGERFPQLTLMPRTDKDEPLYTAPPRREWVGLTREDITEIWLKTYDAVATDYEAYRAIEAKLREKNT
jgi:hypothetical protein